MIIHVYLLFDEVISNFWGYFDFWRLTILNTKWASVRQSRNIKICRLRTFDCQISASYTSNQYVMVYMNAIAESPDLPCNLLSVCIWTEGGFIDYKTCYRAEVHAGHPYTWYEPNNLVYRGNRGYSLHPLYYSNQPKYLYIPSKFPFWDQKLFY